MFEEISPSGPLFSYKEMIIKALFLNSTIANQTQSYELNNTYQIRIISTVKTLCLRTNSISKPMRGYSGIMSNDSSVSLNGNGLPISIPHTPKHTLWTPPASGIATPEPL